MCPAHEETLSIQLETNNKNARQVRRALGNQMFTAHDQLTRTRYRMVFMYWTSSFIIQLTQLRYLSRVDYSRVVYLQTTVNGVEATRSEFLYINKDFNFLTCGMNVRLSLALISTHQNHPLSNSAPTIFSDKVKQVKYTVCKS